MNRKYHVIILLALIAVTSWLSAGNPPENLSLRGIVDWAEAGGHIGSGTSLPVVATAGSRFTDLSVATAPIEYRSNGSSWVAISSSGGPGSGVGTHSSLAGLDFSSSGHTGFASSGSIISAHSALSALDYAGSGHTGFASSGAVITDHAALQNLTFASSGHTGFASASALSSIDSSLTAHIVDQSDPHGATESISVGFTLGTGTPDAFIERTSSGVITIASWARVIPSVASPTSPASGTIWCDRDGIYRVYDQHGSWSTILTDYPRWQDLRVPLLSTNAGGTNAPTPVVVKVNGGSQGVFAHQFSATVEQELYCSIQLPHELYKTHAHPHVHWITPTPAANATAVWGIEYCIANVNATYPAATTIATAAGGAGNVAFKHVLTELPEIDLSGARDSSVLLVRFFRDATNASDTLAACWASDFDLHVQVGDKGSILEYGDN